MALYRMVNLSFWTDAKVVEEFSVDDRYFYLYLFTNPHTNLAGCYEITIAQMANETGLNAEKVLRLLDRFCHTIKVASYNKQTRELLLKNWHKYNWTVSPKFRKPLEKELKAVKCPEYKEYLQALFDGQEAVFKESEKVEGDNPPTLITTYADGTVEVKDSKGKRFTPPTAEEVDAYCKERKNNIDGATFVDFYASKGWKVGNQPMRDWKAAVRTWEGKQKERQAQITKATNQFQQFSQREYTPDAMAELERRKLGVK